MKLQSGSKRRNWTVYIGEEVCGGKMAWPERRTLEPTVPVGCAKSDYWEEKVVFRRSPNSSEYLICRMHNGFLKLEDKRRQA